MTDPTHEQDQPLATTDDEDVEGNMPRARWRADETPVPDGPAEGESSDEDVEGNRRSFRRLTDEPGPGEMAVETDVDDDVEGNRRSFRR